MDAVYLAAGACKSLCLWSFCRAVVHSMSVSLNNSLNKYVISKNDDDDDDDDDDGDGDGDDDGDGGDDHDDVDDDVDVDVCKYV